MKKVVTHSSRFHADDLFATAVIKRVFSDIEIVRTRDAELIKNADIVYDVGSVYDPTAMRFDHHQTGGAGLRKNGIPYASFGLVWKEYGADICGSVEAFERVDERLVQSIDSSDNGVSTFQLNEFNISPFLIQNALYDELPTWKESTSFDEAFFNALPIAERILEREIIKAQHFIEAKDIILSLYQNASDKRIISFEPDHKFGDEIIGEILMNFPEPIFYITYDSADDTWRAKSVRAERGSFKSRKNFPESWAGKTNNELSEVSGIPDAVFCHNKLFLAVAKTYDSALKMAHLALA